MLSICEICFIKNLNIFTAKTPALFGRMHPQLLLGTHLLFESKTKPSMQKQSSTGCVKPQSLSPLGNKHVFEHPLRVV